LTTGLELKLLLDANLKISDSNEFIPSQHGQLVIFVDDIHVPRAESDGCRSSWELLRSFLDSGLLWDTPSSMYHQLGCLTVTAAMTIEHRQNDGLDRRLQRHFFKLSCGEPDHDSVKSSMSAALFSHIASLGGEAEALGQISMAFVDATFTAHKLVAAKFRQSVTQFCEFSDRQLTAVFRSIFQARFPTRVAATDLLASWWAMVLQQYYFRLPTSAQLEHIQECVNTAARLHFDHQLVSAMPNMRQVLSWIGSADRTMPRKFTSLLGPGSLAEWMDLHLRTTDESEVSVLDLIISLPALTQLLSHVAEGIALHHPVVLLSSEELFETKAALAQLAVRGLHLMSNYHIVLVGTNFFEDCSDMPSRIPHELERQILLFPEVVFVIDGTVPYLDIVLHSIDSLLSTNAIFNPFGSAVDHEGDRRRVQIVYALTEDIFAIQRQHFPFLQRATQLTFRLDREADLVEIAENVVGASFCCPG
jgi:hypothetical protein